MSETTLENVAGGLLSVPKAARALRLDPKTVRKALALGEMKSVKLAGAVRIPAAELQRLLAAKET